MRFLVAGLALLVVALAAAPASATTVRLSKERSTQRGIGIVEGTAVVRAQRGERNRLRVTASGRRDRALTISDRAGVRAGRGCRQRSRQTVTCPTSNLETLLVKVSLGARADTARLQGLFGDFRVDAGRGADRVRSWSGGSLDGGPGNDVLRAVGGEFIGGLGDDVMIAGRGDSSFIAERSQDGSDIMRGGPRKRDSVDYSRRRAGVRVDLAGDRDDGAPGERDQLVGIEDLAGGRGDDVLVGSGGANSIVTGDGADVAIGGNGFDTLVTTFAGTDSGDPGDRFVGGRGGDFISGGSGPDTIVAGPGWDKVSGEAGDDRVDLRDGRRDDVKCGEGDETLTLDRFDYFTSRDGTCESVQREGPAGAMLSNPFSEKVGTEVGSSVAGAILGCPGDGPATCEGSARLDVAGRPGQPVAFSIARDETAGVRVPFEDDPGQTVRGDLVVETNLPGGGVSTLVYRDALTIVR